MISCTEFIPAYSELFKLLEELGGKHAVVKYWNHLSDNYLNNLRDLVSTKGLQGCWEYWAVALNEEAADFTMELDEDKDEFRITIHRCPSKGRLLQYKHIEPYPAYCEHCAILYARVLEPLGFKYKIDLSASDQARCSITVHR